MKNIRLFNTITFFFLFINLFSQNNFKAEYKIILEKNGYAPIYYTLISKDLISEFKLLKRTTPDKVVNNEYTGEVVLNPERPDSIQPLIITNHKLNKIYVKNFITENDGESYDQYNSVEPITVSWKFENETKRIGKYLCNKATAKFRGRFYTAWYSEEIPINIGPWKFHGLPGVIVNITDDTNKVSFILEKVEIPYKDLNINFKKIDTTKLISIEDFLIKRKNAKIKSEIFFRNKILSKLPRGASIELTKDENNDIEKEM